MRKKIFEFNESFSACVLGFVFGSVGFLGWVRALLWALSMLPKVTFHVAKSTVQGWEKVISKEEGNHSLTPSSTSSNIAYFVVQIRFFFEIFPMQVQLLPVANRNAQV